MPYHNIMVINQTGTAWHSPAGNRILAEKRDILLEVKMLTIKDYCLAESIQQAYELNRKKQNRILGGGIWLKCCHFPIQTAIDLSGLGLEGITETEEGFEIGAMTSLRQLETHEGLNACTCGAVKEALRHIVGTQFRNCATVGGSLFGRFGFSDVLTLFLGDVYKRQIILCCLILKDILWQAMEAQLKIFPSVLLPQKGKPTSTAEEQAQTCGAVNRMPFWKAWQKRGNP